MSEPPFVAAWYNMIGESPIFLAEDNSFLGYALTKLLNRAKRFWRAEELLDFKEKHGIKSPFILVPYSSALRSQQDEAGMRSKPEDVRTGQMSADWRTKNDAIMAEARRSLDAHVAPVGDWNAGTGEQPAHDPVERPAHYTQGAVECIDAIEAALSKEEFVGFLRGQVMKYNWRLAGKGHPGEDARKAAWYLHRLIEALG